MSTRGVSALRIFTILLLLNACKTSGPGIFGKKTPHEQYGDKLVSAGLRSTALGDLWFRVAEQSLSSPLSITVPYKETGYFPPDRPMATGLRFNALRGQKLSISVEKKPAINFAVYIDLWKAGDGNNQPKHITAADTTTNSLQHEVTETSQYILRLQPELLSSGEFTVTITAGPALAYPIKAPGRDHIKSFWGANRDGGARKHEGVDMFAARGTPVLAAADGRVTKVTETAIGGKVVWVRVKDRDYTLYYAHLDSQLVTDGQQVRTDDTLGLMGNTGNASSTSPHLHFGIYTSSGPIDPLAFINPVNMLPDDISAPTRLLGKLARVSNPSSELRPEPRNNTSGTVRVPLNTPVMIEAATSTWYKVSLPNGLRGFIKKSALQQIEKPVRTFFLETTLPLLEKPDSLAAKKTSIPTGEPVDILGNFEDHYLVKTRENITGWIAK